MLYSEADPSINSKGLKISPKEVMMNYLSNPVRALKTIQNTLFFINNSKINESIFLFRIIIYLI